MAGTILCFFVLSMGFELLNLFPASSYVTGSFPTYFHGREQVVIFFLLILVLTGATFGNYLIQNWSVVVIGALAIYASFGVVLGNDPSMPMSVNRTWLVAKLTVISNLAWIYISALLSGLLKKKDMLMSFIISCAGLLYLLLVYIL